jgi:hypothetical protein
VDLGERTLKDLDRPVRLFELAAPGLEARDSLATAQPGGGAAAALGARHNLPAPLISFLGREQNLARLERLPRETRLVTLTGTGGTGENPAGPGDGARVVGRFPDGVWLAELAGIADPDWWPRS